MIRCALYLVWVFSVFVILDHKLDSCAGKDLPRLLTTVVSLHCHYATSTYPDYEERARPTWLHIAVERCILQGHSSSRCLYNRILLGMDGTNAVQSLGAVVIDDLHETVTNFVTVRKLWRSAYISSAKYLLVPDHDTAASPSVASGPAPYDRHQLQEVLIPAWPVRHSRHAPSPRCL